ncbi:DUF3137 domain-containing protein [Virgibacillus oceani]
MKNIDDMYQLERFSKTDEEFDLFYENELKDKVEELEKERLKAMEIVKKQAMKLILPVIGLILIYFLLSDLTFYAFVAVALYGAYLFKEVINKRKELSKKIKDEIVTDLVHFLNENFTYEPRKYLARKQFVRSNIFKNNPDRYSGDDLITGFVGSDKKDVKDMDSNPTKTDLSFSEVHAQKVERYKDKNGRAKERVHTIFQGLFFIADYNKDFDGLTIVVPKQKKINLLPSIFDSNSKNKLEEVELEDLDFMDKFTVRTTDQITARYILTPNFMNRLIEFTTREPEKIDQQNQPKSIKEAFQMGLSGNNSSEAYFETAPYFSFLNGKMYFMLPTKKKHFEFNLLLPLNKHLIKGYFSDINIALELVDELNLNLRIWNKE